MSAANYSYEELENMYSSVPSNTEEEKMNTTNYSYEELENIYCSSSIRTEKRNIIIKALIQLFLNESIAGKKNNTLIFDGKNDNGYFRNLPVELDLSNEFRYILDETAITNIVADLQLKGFQVTSTNDVDKIVLKIDYIENRIHQQRTNNQEIIDPYRARDILSNIYFIFMLIFLIILFFGLPA